MRWITRRSLRLRISLSLAVLVFLVAGVIGGLIGRVSERQARDSIGQSLAVDAQRMAERLNGEMAARTRELTLLATTDALRDLPGTAVLAPGIGVTPALGASLARTQALLDELKRSFAFYTWIAVAAPSGRVLAATDPSSIGTDISTRSAFRQGLRGPGVGTIPQPVVDGRVMDIVQNIRDADGLVVGVIAAQLAWSWMREIERSIITSDSDGQVRRETFLVSSQDTVLQGPVGTVGETLSLPAVGRARAGFYGWSVEDWPPLSPGASAEPFLTGRAFATGEGPAPAPGSQPMQWTVLVREAERVAFAPATVLREAIWGVGLVVAAIFACAGWLLSGMITAPLARIAVAAERLRQGDDVEIPRIRGAAELQTLSNTLRALVATLTRKQMALDEMEALALRDPLTGLLNRHGLRLHLEQALRRAHAEKTSLMVFVGDLDGFKAVNDSLGHATGDLLLCQVADRLTHAVRAQDIVARLGGDEFMLALPAPGGPHDAVALSIATRAQAAITSPYELAGTRVMVGCSLGGACWPEHITSAVRDMGVAAEIDQVIQRADAALYAVKRTGKGRVRVHDQVASLAERA